MRVLHHIPTVVLAALVVISCQGEPPLGPSTGTLQITTTSTGPELDSDGYAIRLDGGDSRAIGIMVAGGSIELDAGDHSVLLERLAQNCSVAGENPRVITIIPDRTSTIAFLVTCSATAGTLVITTSTSGESPDPDGFDVIVNGVARGMIAANSSLTISGLAGATQVELSGVAPHCQVEGENPRQVTVTPGGSVGTTFRILCLPAAGTKIAFDVSRSGGRDIFSMNRDGSGQRNITPDVAQDLLPSWSPDGRKILYMSYQGWSPGVMVVMNADGSGPTKLATQGRIDGYPWSPNGQKIVFVTDAGQIGVMNADGSEPRVLTSDLRGSYQPAWSPDGARLAFRRKDIIVMNADGSAQTAVSQPAAAEDDQQPHWSPDGSRIAFIRSITRGSGDEQETATNLWVMNSDGSSPRRLTNYVLDGHNPTISGFSWSPDGSRLVFSNGWDLYRIRPDGSDLVNLTESPYEFELDPIWSPDGTRILFRGSPVVPAVPDLFVIDPNGDNRLNLTNNQNPTAYYGTAGWQP